MPKRKASELTSDLFDGTVTVVVGTGSTQKSFTLYKGILSYYSDYFGSAIDGSFAEAKSGIIDLPDEDVGTFQNFVLWLYGKPIQPGPIPENRSCFRPYCELWVFGDRRQIPQLMNSMIDELRATIVKEWKLPLAVMRYVYENTTANAELRRFLVTIFLECRNRHSFEEHHRKDWPEEALFDIMKEIWSERQRTWKSRAEFGSMDLTEYYRSEPVEITTEGDGATPELEQQSSAKADSNT